MMVSPRSVQRRKAPASKKGKSSWFLFLLLIASVFGWWCSVLLNCWEILDDRRVHTQSVVGVVGGRKDERDFPGKYETTRVHSAAGNEGAHSLDQKKSKARALGLRKTGTANGVMQVLNSSEVNLRPSLNFVENGMGQMSPKPPPHRKGRKEVEEGGRKIPLMNQRFKRAELEEKGMLGEWILYRINEPATKKNVPRIQDRFEFQFCQVAHFLHTEQPYSLAFFKDLISASGCYNQRTHKKMNWDQAEKYLESQRAMNKVVPPTGFLHHEARCGSTLVTNILASNPRAIAYSEPPAVVNAGGKVCRDCPREIRVRLLQLAVGLMGLSAKHDYVFFKLMPSNMLEADLFKEAFPTTPYIWIHRDPVGVMMSQLKVERPPDHNAFNDQFLPGMPMLQAGARHRGGKRGGLPAPPSKGGNVGGLPPCLRRLKEVDDSLGIALKSKEEMPSREEYCAEYLAVTSRAAVEAMATDPLGMPVAYEQEPDLATHVIDFLLPMFFGVQLDEDARQRAVVVSRSYSKGSRFRRVEDGGSYAGDVAKKRDAAWPNLVAEAGEHTRGVYERLVAMEREKVVALRQLSAGRGWLGRPR